MSSCGWLVTVGDDHTVHLINPLSREIINLPKIGTFSSRLDIRKFVFLAPSSLVVVLSGCLGQLGFCRIGDKKWTPIDKGILHRMILDITFYHGHIYCLDCLFCIQAWDVCGENPTKIVIVSSQPEDFYARQRVFLDRSYILGLDDDDRKRLLVVARKTMFDDTEDKNLPLVANTKSYQILEYDLASEKWSKLKDLGSKALFVGYNSSFWMEEDATGAIKGNCIYFTDDAHFISTEERGRDMGIYHLSDRTIESHFTG